MNAKEIGQSIGEIKGKGDAIIQKRKEWLIGERTAFEERESRLMIRCDGEELKKEITDNIRDFLTNFVDYLDGFIYYDFDGIREHYYFFFNDENAQKYSYSFIRKVLSSFLSELERVKGAKEGKVEEWESAKSNVLRRADEREMFLVSDYYLLRYKDNVRALNLLIKEATTSLENIKQWQATEKKKRSKKTKAKYTIEELAIWMCYENPFIREDEASELLAKYGHSSTQKFFDLLSVLATVDNRVKEREGDTKKKVSNRLARFKKMAELIDNKKKKDKIEADIILLENTLAGM